jgi:hypothetical protein
MKDNASGLRQEVIREMETLPDDQVRNVLRFIKSLRQRSRSTRSIDEKIEAIVDEAPDDIWKNVPADGAEQHDHYIYGAPKQTS